MTSYLSSCVVQPTSSNCLILHLKCVTKYASVGENADGLELVKQKSAVSTGHHIGKACRTVEYKRYSLFARY